MDKILSKDTIKNVFSALGAKTSDSNYGVALLDKTSGEPKGFMGMSDLASVLGGINREIINGYNHPEVNILTAYNKSKSSYYIIGLSRVQGKPSDLGTDDYGYMEVRNPDSDNEHIRTLVTESGKQYTSRKSGAWMRIDNFGCSTPEALASLLGGQLGGKGYYSGNSDSNGTITFTVDANAFNSIYFARYPSLSGRVILFSVISDGVDTIFVSNGFAPTMTKDSNTHTITITVGGFGATRVELIKI